MRKIRHYRLPLVVLALIAMSFTTVSMLSNPNCPISYTGAPKATTPNLGQVRYCTSCHGDFTMNTAGGGIVVTGLPGTSYTPGQVYNFSIRINHASANRTIWGFAIKAVNAVDNKVVGTFSTTNANASLKGSASANTSELSHSNAPVTAAANNYTFANLKWTAPATPGANDANIKFYVIANAGNNDNGEAGDYIYTTTLTSALSVLPVKLNSFTVTQKGESGAELKWQTQYEQNTAGFDIETSADGSNWIRLATVAAAGNSGTVRNYTYTDNVPAAYNTNLLYRIKMNDKDGSYKYSDIKTIRIKNAGIVITSVTAQPLHQGQSPVFDVHSNTTGKLNVTVFNISGTTLGGINTIINQGTNRIQVPLTGNAVASGIYFIKFTSGDYTRVIKQVVN